MAIVDDDDDDSEEEESKGHAVPREAEEEKIAILVAEAEDHKEVGNTHYAAGKHSKALACFSKAIAALPPATAGDTWRFADYAARYYNMRSSCHIQMGSYPETVDDCNMVLHHATTGATRTAALLRRSFAHESMGLVSKAQGDLRDILEADPRNEKALKSMARLGKVADDEMEIKMKQLKDKGNKEFGAKSFASAARIYSEGIELFDKLGAAVKRRKESVVVASQLRTNRALAYIRQKDRLEQALSDCDWVLSSEGGNDSNNHKAHYRRGLALKLLNRWCDALGAFERAQALSPSKAHAGEVAKAQAQCKKLGLSKAKKPTKFKIQIVEEDDEPVPAPTPTVKKGFKKMNIQMVDDDDDSSDDEAEAIPPAKVQASPKAEAKPSKAKTPYPSPKAKTPTPAAKAKAKAPKAKASPSPAKKSPSKKASSSSPSSPATPGLYKVPKTHAQFDRVWKRLKGKPEDFYAFFKGIPLTKYKAVFGGAGALREEQLHTIFKTVKDHYCNGSEGDAQQGLRVLDALTATNRFDLNIMMLSGPAEKTIAAMWKKLRGVSSLDGNTIGEIEKKYDC